MTPRENKARENAEPQVPQGLADRLAALFPTPRVPREVDAAVLAEARRHFARRRRVRRLVRWAGAAAAVLLLAIGLMVVRQERAREAPGPQAHSAAEQRVAREDINGDGQVDILDAFALARRLKAGGPLAAEWDLTGDRRVDQADVDRVALAAVKLERGRFQ